MMSGIIDRAWSRVKILSIPERYRLHSPAWRGSRSGDGLLLRSGDEPLLRSGDGPLLRSGDEPLLRSGDGPLLRSGDGPLLRQNGGPAPVALVGGDAEEGDHLAGGRDHEPARPVPSFGH